MYIGQALKEFFLEERPKYPALQMQKKWSNEYSLPSTHAMSSPSIAITIMYFAVDRYEINFYLAAFLAFIWIMVVSWSRVYLGMHSVLDLLMGFTLSAFLLFVGLPITEAIETFLTKSIFALFVLLAVVVILAVYFPVPSTKLYTPTK
jgi:sphingosine-1-phosphate phosphatase 1